MFIPRELSHKLRNRIQVILSAIEMEKDRFAIDKLKELALYVDAHTETAEEEELRKREPE